MTRVSARILAPVALAIGASSLAACSDQAAEPGTTSEAQVDSSIAEILVGQDNLSTAAKALQHVGLESVFDGEGSYTFLAPNDAAFEALGEAGAELLAKENRPFLVAVLRDHIVPGHLTLEAITEAAGQNGGSVDMRTLGGSIATFSAGQDGLSVSLQDGDAVQVSGGALAGSNGVIIPVGGLLVAPATAE